MTTETIIEGQAADVAAEPKKVTRKSAAQKLSAKIEAPVTEASKQVEAATSNAMTFVRNVAYAYVGTIAKSIDAMETVYNKVKSDRKAVFEELVSSGESFVETYETKVKDQADQVVSRIKSMTKKSDADSEETKAAA